MATIDAKFQVTVPENIANRLNVSEKRKQIDFEVYMADDYNRIILFEDDIFIFLIKSEDNDIFISSNSEFNVILNSKDNNIFTVDFLVDHN